MEIGGVEINFPEQIKNIIVNTCFENLVKNEVERLKIRETLKIFNKNGVSSETALKILSEQVVALAEIENLYGGGEN